MSLMASKKMNLLQQPINLSYDEEILPYIDEQTTSLNYKVLQQHQNLNFLKEYSDLEKRFNKIKAKTQMDEINQLYDKNMHNLFQQDSLTLKQITIELENNKKLNSKTNTLSKIHKKMPLDFYDQSLSSISSKYNTLKFQISNKQNLMHKKAKETIISYKVGKQTPKFNKNSQSSSQFTKMRSAQRTPQKKSISKINSKSNLKQKQPKSDLQRSDNKSIKFIQRPISSSIIQESLSALKKSNSKDSLFFTNKIKTNSKKQNMQQTAKRRLKSFSSLDNHSQAKDPYHTESTKLSKNKDNNKKIDILRKIIKINSIRNKNIFFKQQSNVNDNEQKLSKVHHIITQIPKQHYENEQQLLINNFQSQGYLQEIIVEILSKQDEKIEEKQRLEEQITRLKQKITLENKRLHQTTNKNSKLMREIDTINKFKNLVSQQNQKTKQLLNQTKRKVKSLKQTLTLKNQLFKKVTEIEVKEQQQLIEMYENVINELKKQIREQNKKKSQIKSNLQKSLRKLQSKQSRFNSTALSTKKLKNDLTDAFKEWI